MSLKSTGYEVYIERAAERYLKKLSLKECQKIASLLKSLGEIDDRARAVRVMRIRHRREAYR